ncbi:MAG: hypothetical protein SF029_18080 [bacterium]|nr:hypothetical protein [bacterium]
MEMPNNADWNLDESLHRVRVALAEARRMKHNVLIALLEDAEHRLLRGIRLNHERLRSMYQLGWREGNPVGYLPDDYELVEQEED